MNIVNNELQKSGGFLARIGNIKGKLNDITDSLEQNKIAIDQDDSLLDKTFFVFLVDLLNSFKKIDKILFWEN